MPNIKIPITYLYPRWMRASEPYCMIISGVAYIFVQHNIEELDDLGVCIPLHTRLGS